MPDENKMSAELQAVAAYCQPKCDWTAVSHHIPGGAGISIPTCMICGRVNGADIREQIAAIVALRTEELCAELARAEQATTITAERLAMARQKVAHRGTGYVHPWELLTDIERAVATAEAESWVKALALALAADAAAASEPEVKP